MVVVIVVVCIIGGGTGGCIFEGTGDNYGVNI